MSAFEQECLEAHNKYRALHNSPPLQLNRNLCLHASEWAQHLAATNTLQHRDNSRYGENLYMASGRTISGIDAVRAWYDEVSKYSYSKACFGPGTGHFTQVIWRGSQQLGVGVAKRGSSTWVVANYDPAGNYAGRFADNVTPRMK